MRRSRKAVVAVRRAALAGGAVLALGLGAAAPAGAADAPIFEVGVHAVPTHLRPGSSGQIRVVADNVGTARKDATLLRYDVTLPPGLTWRSGSDAECSATPDGVSCTPATALASGVSWFKLIQVDVAPDAPVGPAPVTATVSGGGAAAVTVTKSVRIDPEPAGFGIDTFSPAC